MENELKQKQIEGMAKDMLEYALTYFPEGTILKEQFYLAYLGYAQHLIKAGYRKIPEGAVVQHYEAEIEALEFELSQSNKVIKTIRKETAEKFAELWKKRLSMYSHIHQFAKDAQTSTEVYADGEPVEMESVWDVLTLKKNGYDDYETMAQLQDNIEYIAKSRLLREIDKDVDEICKEISEGK